MRQELQGHSLAGVLDEAGGEGEGEARKWRVVEKRVGTSESRDRTMP